MHTRNAFRTAALLLTLLVGATLPAQAHYAAEADAPSRGLLSLVGFSAGPDGSMGSDRSGVALLEGGFELDTVTSGRAYAPCA